jgi:hypothetical protein
MSRVMAAGCVRVKVEMAAPEDWHNVIVANSLTILAIIACNYENN